MATNTNKVDYNPTKLPQQMAWWNTAFS